MNVKEIISPWIDYPALSTSSCIAAIRSYLRPFYIGRSYLLSRIRIVSEQPYYCYIVDVNNQFEYRSVSWKPQRASGRVHSSSSSRVSLWDMSLSVPSSFEDSYEVCEVPDSIVCGVCPYCSIDSASRDISHCYVNTSSVFLDSLSTETPLLPSESPSCTLCGGSGVAEYRKVIRADFKTKTFSKYVDSCNLGMNCLRTATGILGFSIKGNRLHCRQPFLDEQLNQTVSSLLDEVDEWSSENQAMIRCQQLYVSVIPVKIMDCMVGEQLYHMTVYDIDGKVICPEFSSRWCSLWRRFFRM